MGNSKINREKQTDKISCCKKNYSAVRHKDGRQKGLEARKHNKSIEQNSCGQSINEYLIYTRQWLSALHVLIGQQILPSS
jgi:hypothetical protein